MSIQSRLAKTVDVVHACRPKDEIQLARDDEEVTDTFFPADWKTLYDIACEELKAADAALAEKTKKLKRAREEANRYKSAWAKAWGRLMHAEQALKGYRNGIPQ